MNEELLARARKIKVILNDVDGIWTDGKLHFYVNPEGKIEEIKSFNALDGIAVMLCRLAGLKCGVITGRRHETTVSRARNLGMNFFYQGYLTKTLALEDILKRENISLDEVAYIGDDLTDLPSMEKVGLAITVPNAVQAVKDAAHYVTARQGGSGAYREAIDFILTAQGKMPALLKQVGGGWHLPQKAELEIITSQEGIN
ncbi:MAG: HAD hydrolase family protein [Elusimicrobiaceae bacterium]|nr:HAD hydrolase family protein [Elusimicrobiaceae bacterium]